MHITFKSIQWFQHFFRCCRKQWLRDKLEIQAQQRRNCWGHDFVDREIMKVEVARPGRIIRNFHGLEWTFTPLARSDVAFMDMSLSIENDRVESTLYEKKLALYLYIPPNSAHPPGVTAGLVMGNVLRIMQLCTKKQDIQSRLDDFLGRMLNRGHQLSTLLPLFDKAVNNANNYLSRSDDEKLALAEKAASREKSIPPCPIPSGQPTSKHNPTSLARDGSRTTRYETVESNDKYWRGGGSSGQTHHCKSSCTKPWQSFVLSKHC